MTGACNYSSFSQAVTGSTEFTKQLKFTDGQRGLCTRWLGRILTKLIADTPWFTLLGKHRSRHSCGAFSSSADQHDKTEAPWPLLASRFDNCLLDWQAFKLTAVNSLLLLLQLPSPSYSFCLQAEKTLLLHYLNHLLFLFNESCPRLDILHNCL